jgi:hypothetical protein
MSRMVERKRAAGQCLFDNTTLNMRDHRRDSARARGRGRGKGRGRGTGRFSHSRTQQNGPKLPMRLEKELGIPFEAVQSKERPRKVARADGVKRVRLCTKLAWQREVWALT